MSKKTRCFERVVSLLGGPKAEIISHIGVVVEFLRTIWSERPIELPTLQQTGLVLTNLLKCRNDWGRVIALLRGIYQRRFYKDGPLDKYILGWLQGHFLVPFGKMSLPRANLG
jgi:hypothetical protein